MHRPLLSAALLLALSAPFTPTMSVLAQTAPAPALNAQPRPSDTYLEGYLKMLDGDKMLAAKDFVGAYYKYREAREVFDSVHATDPGWNPDIIDYRRRKIRESMEHARKLEVERRANGGEISEKGLIGSVKEAVPRTTPQDIPESDPASAPRRTGDVMEEKMRTLMERIKYLEKRNEEIFKSLGVREEELRKASAERLESRKSEEALRKRLIEAQDRLQTADASEKRKHKELLARISDLESALTDANAKLAEANVAREKLQADLAAANTLNIELTKERDTLRKDLTQMMELLSGGDGKAPQKLKLVEENRRLKAELDAAKEKMTQLSKEKDADKAEIAALKSQVQTVQDSLAAMQQENEDYRQQIAALTSKLEATRALLESGGTLPGSISDNEAIAENEVLRQVILTQLKQQSRRDAARKNMMAELSKEGVFEKLHELGVESETLLRSVNAMAAPVELTREQRDILASTKVGELLSGPGGKEIIVISDSHQDIVGPDVPTHSTGAKDKEMLSTELKAYANAGEQHFQSGDFPAAENNFRKILVSEPQNVYALTNLGVTQIKLGSHEEASATLLKSLAYDYENDFTHYARGVALLHCGRMEEAGEELYEGLKINEANGPAWHTLGLLANKQGRRTEARDCFLKAVQFDPDCADAHYNLAVLYLTGNPQQPELARKHYRSALKAGAARNSDLDKLLGMR
jgi:Flp pilus assembly protein TadD